MGGVLGRDVDHTSVEVDVVPQFLRPGLVVCCRELGGVHERPWGVVLQTSCVDDVSAVEQSGFTGGDGPPYLDLVEACRGILEV